MKSINQFLDENVLGRFNVVVMNLRKITGNVLRALVTANGQGDPVLFRHGGALVWIEFDDDGSPAFREITLDRMRLLLARRFSWYRRNLNGKEVAACPPMEVVRDVLVFPNIDLPVVERIVCVPFFAPDGTIQTEPGYNPATRAIFQPCDDMDAMLPVSDSPDSDEMATALAIFDDVVVDFPFVGPGKTHTLAALLVPFVRALIDGPTPLHLLEKPAPGTGATLLAQVICDICLGYPVAAMTEAHGEDEFSRKIHSKLRSGPTAILLDNLRHHLDSAALAVALTNDMFGDRIIQRSEIASAPVRCLWLATANNPSLSPQMARRTIPIRLDAQMERPHLRTDFRQANLREFVRSNHALLVWAVLTMVRGWIAAGRPKGTKKLGMYESYSEVIGGILDVAGVPGFLDIPQEQAALEDDEASLAPLIPLWLETFGFDTVSTAQLFELRPELDLGGKTEMEQKIRLGKLLRANRDRRFGDLVIVHEGKRGGSSLWRLVRVAGCSSTGGQGAG